METQDLANLIGISGWVILAGTVFRHYYKVKKDMKDNFAKVYGALSKRAKQTSPFTNREEYHELREITLYLDVINELNIYPEAKNWNYAKSLMYKYRLWENTSSSSH